MGKSNGASDLFERTVVAGEKERKRGEGKGFVGLSSLASDHAIGSRILDGWHLLAIGQGAAAIPTTFRKVASHSGFAKRTSFRRTALLAPTSTSLSFVRRTDVSLSSCIGSTSAEDVTW